MHLDLRNPEFNEGRVLQLKYRVVGLGKTAAVLFWIQGSHRLEKYLNIQDRLEKYLKINFALKST